MKKSLFFICIVFCQVIITSQKDLIRSRAISLFNDDHASVQKVSSSRVENQTSYPNTSMLLDDDDNASIVPQCGDSFVKPYRVKTIDLTFRPKGIKKKDLVYLFENDIDEFFASIDFADQDSLIEFLLAIINKKIIIKNDYLKQEVINMIILELDFTRTKELYLSLKHDQNQIYVKNMLKERMNKELFNENNYIEESLVKNKEKVFIDFFILASLDRDYIPTLLEASKHYKDKTFLKTYFDPKDTKFLLELILVGFFNDSKENLLDLLKKCIEEYNKPLVSAILYQVFFSFSQDAEFIKEIKNEIDAQIKTLQVRVTELSNKQSFEQIKQEKILINELQAINSLKDDFFSLSAIDHMFYSAYLEYLKGNKQDLRNLVFPVGKNVYVLAPQKGSQAQAMSLIRNSLNKIFEKDRIKFLLFDLVETEYQKQRALDLLDFMQLRSKPQNSPAAEASV